MKQTFATVDELLYCRKCGVGIILCTKCNKEFKKNEDILCDEMPKPKHYCYKCQEGNDLNKLIQEV